MAEVKNLRSSLIREFDEVAYAKLVLLGTMAVGKTSLVTRFCFDTHKENQKATTQVDFATVKVSLPDTKKPIVLQIWDTVGQERFSSMNTSFLRRSAAAVVVYDVTDRDSFMNINRFLLDIDKIIPEAEVVIVGNKTDRSDRAISTEEGEMMAKARDCEFLETSAKTGHNVVALFHGLARTLIKKHQQKNRDVVNLNKNSTQKKGGCCKS